jgi:hypothetical protein
MRIDRSIRVTRMQRVYSIYNISTHTQINTKNGDRARRERESEENQCQKKSVELHLHANPRFSRSFAAG